MPGNLNAWRRIGLKWPFFRCFPAIPTSLGGKCDPLGRRATLAPMRFSLPCESLGDRCVLGSSRRRAELPIAHMPRGPTFTGCR